MIDIYLQTRPNKSWVASATIDGSTFRVVSRGLAYEGASNQLAAILKRRGVPDQPIRIHNPSGNRPVGQEPWFWERPSLYDWATYNHQAEWRKYAEAVG